MLSRLDLGWRGSSMCCCMLSGFGLFGPRLVGFAVRAFVLCLVVSPSLQVLRAGAMFERFTARMRVLEFHEIL